MTRRLAVIGAPSGAGACGVGQEQTPAAIRAAGLIGQLRRVGFEVRDLGDSPVIPWRPDRANPRAQNLQAVLETIQTTTKRVADALAERDRIALVLGGDCTVGIGTVAGIQQAIGRVALAYFDLHSDLNTPTSATDGALDWMALGHMLAIEGTEPTLTTAAGDGPLLDPDQVVLFAHDRSHSTRFERGEIERLGLARVALEQVRADPGRSRRSGAGAPRHPVRPLRHPPRCRRRQLHRRAALRAPVAQHGPGAQRSLAWRSLGSWPRRSGTCSPSSNGSRRQGPTPGLWSHDDPRLRWASRTLRPDLLLPPRRR
jgi:arginase